MYFLLDSVWLTAVLVVLLSVLWSGYVYLTWNFSYWKQRNVNYLTPNLFFGNFGDLAMMRTNAGNLFRDLYQKGKGNELFGIWIFRKPALVISSPELIRSILVKDFNHFADRSTYTDENYDPLGSGNLFFGRNPVWRIMRNKLSHMFSSAKLKNMFSVMGDSSKDLEEHIRSHISQPVDIIDICDRFNTDVLAATTYGIKANSLTDKNAHFYQMRKRVVEMGFFRSIEFMSIFFMHGFAKYWKCKVFANDFADWLRNLFWKTAKEREENDDKRNDLVGMLMNLKDQTKDNDAIKFIGDRLVGQTAVFFTVGSSSSTHGNSLLYHLLALHPDVQDKLAEEILRILQKHNNEVTYEAINEMTYLDMCVKETLRMFPPIPFIDRKCTKSYPVPGSSLVIEEGTDVYIPVLGIQTDEDYFAYPDTFKPERFDKADGDGIHPFTYLPFGEGPRSCIGERYGILQIKTSVVHILKSFIVQTCDKTQAALRWKPLCLSPTPRDGLFVRFVERGAQDDGLQSHVPADQLIKT